MNPFSYAAGAVPMTADNIPTKPPSPSVGYPTRGIGLAMSTTPGEFYFYKLAREFYNLLRAANITPSDDDLSQILKAIQALTSAIPAGYEQLFRGHSTAPPGWTRVTDSGLHDSIIRILAQAGAPSNGGANGMTSRLVSTTSTEDFVLEREHIPPHKHYVGKAGKAGQGRRYTYSNTKNNTLSMEANNGNLHSYELSYSDPANATPNRAPTGDGSDTAEPVGSSQNRQVASGHNHTVSLNVKYTDFIVCRKV